MNSYFQANAKLHSKNISDNSINIKWHPPDHNFVKLNFDGSVCQQKAAAGFVVRNDMGQILGAGSFNMDGL